MHFEATVGPSAAADGNDRPLRLGKVRELIVSQAHGKYAEAVLRGKAFVAATAATGVAPGTAIGTTAPFTLYNPANSGVRLVILRAVMGYVSGTLGAGVVHYVANVVNQAAAPTGTAITPTNTLLGSALAATAKAFTTATLPATPTLLRPFASLQASLATTAVAPWQIDEDVDGEFVVDQGSALSFESTAAGGSSPLVMFGLSWEEVPI